MKQTTKVIILVGALIFLGFFIQHYLKKTPKNEGDSAKTETEIISVSPDITGWKELDHGKMKFAIKHPAEFSVRASQETDTAILTLPAETVGGHLAMISFLLRRTPTTKPAYPDIEAFWADEERSLTYAGGTIQAKKSISLNEKIYLEVHEDNRQNNYLSLHRYIQGKEGTYDIELKVDGERIPEIALKQFNEVMATLEFK